MRYNIIVAFLVSFFSLNAISAGPKVMDNKYFSIKVSCEGHDKCIYNNEREIPVVVTIENISSKSFFIPMEFIKKSGPAVELFDSITKKSIPLRPNLASWDLKKKMAHIPANESVSFEWDILDAEISPFVVDGSVNIIAFFSILTNVYDLEGNDSGEFISSAKLIITGKGLNEVKH